MKIFSKNITLLLLLFIALGIWFFTKNNHDTKKIKEKILTTASESQITSLDPVQIPDLVSIREVAKVYEGLVEYHYLKRPYELIPNLAEAMPTISKNGLVYTFKIKQGVMFQDDACFPNGKGRELTAEDFVYSLKRVADPKIQAPYFSLIAEKIQGLDTWRKNQSKTAQTDYTIDVTGLQALDRYTLQVTLTNPFYQLLYIVAMPTCYAVPQEAVNHYGLEFVNHPVGTGPFVLEAYTPQANKLTYRKNPNFREKFFPSEAADQYKHMLADAGKKLPLVDKITTYILPEEQPRWLKFKKGEFDVVDISRDNIALEVIRNKTLVPELIEKGMALFIEPEATTHYFAINNSDTLFKKNVKLRQAMSLAFNGKKYNQLFHNSTGVLAQSTIAPGLAGYDANYVNPYLIYDIEKAKQYLEEAGYPGGKGLPEITLDVKNTTDENQKGEFFKKCMATIGIKIKIIQNIYPELIKKMYTKATMLHLIRWVADYPDAETFLSLFYLDNLGIGEYYNNPTYNTAYKKTESMPDSPTRTMLYEQLNKIAAENVPAIYIVHPQHICPYQGWLKNYVWFAFDYGSEQYFNIDLDKKQLLLSR